MIYSPTVFKTSIMTLFMQIIDEHLHIPQKKLVLTLQLNSSNVHTS